MDIFGYKIIVQPPHPKIAINDSDFYMSQSVKEEINTWLASTFGYNPPIMPDGEVIGDEMNKVLHMNETTFNLLRKQLNDPH